MFFCLFSGKIDVTCGTYMRQIISEAVASDPDNYNEAILGRPNVEYCKWIEKSNTWGGNMNIKNFLIGSTYNFMVSVIVISLFF